MEVKKRKGRPARGSEESNENKYISVINDPVIYPFYIQKDRSNFNVFELTTTTRGYGGAAGGGKEVEKFIGHYTSFKNALIKISKEKFYTNKENYSSIKDYMNDWNKLKEGIETLLNQIEI